MTPALALDDVRVRFGDVRALDGATFAARAGTVHALLGENGAGKTTLMRVAFGAVRPTAGTIAIDGRPVRLASPADAIQLGIGMVHQHFTLVPAMTVAENVALGGLGGGWRFDAGRTSALVERIGRETGLELSPDARVATLGVSAQQRLEIVKSLARDARILILDEPTAVLSPIESEELLRRLRRLADDGRAIVLITHKLREALQIADDVTVLRDGRTVLQARAADVSAATLASAMLGESAGGFGSGSAGSAPGGEPIPVDARPVIAARSLELDDDRGVRRIHGATFHVRAGEIVGIGAVEGSGHRELLRALAGRSTIAGGALELPRSIGYVPEDRQHEALALDLDLTENVALRGAGRRRGLVAWSALRRRTQELMVAHDVRAPHARVAARTLSGGNQQKLVLARELDGPPEALVAVNPTRGLDVRATEAVHERLRAARRSGMAVVLYSGDVDETLALADRMLVVFDGTVREVPRERSAVGAAMVGIA